MIDSTKSWQTRDGQSVRIVTTEGRGRYPVLGYVGDNEDISLWCSGGYDLYSRRHLDLVQVPEKFVRYINLYNNSTHTAYRTRSEADEAAGAGRVACIRAKYVQEPVNN